MPKLKTHKATQKRVSVTKTGKLQHKRPFGNHFLQKKSKGRKRRIATPAKLSGKQVRSVRTKLGV